MAKLLFAMIVLVVAIPASAGKDYDKHKFEELARRREHRRAVEGFYKDCLHNHGEKCLEKSRKFSEKRLAGLSNPR